jgi:hypothetical protein
VSGLLVQVGFLFGVNFFDCLRGIPPGVGKSIDRKELLDEAFGS